ncbi:c-type cytochrome [Bisbaumannia pacifica]|uniref:Cytochrome n=1 Tax=Bisbaumannia pacifica TaxID=77098 RepID=A0A510XAR2_9GAMM|nr:c-type cytochrome [Halomonas pacifica]MBH8579253.1 c-type cytochrome [Halomonas pacifica]GEK48516.1 cytochrome [Halomonas pacifica]
MSDRQPTAAGAELPKALASPERFGVVVRPPHYAWDGEHFASDHLVAIERDSVAGLPGRIEVVVEGDFVAVVADSLTAAQDAARNLRLEWRTASGKGHDGSPAMVAETARELANEASSRALPPHRHDYGWPSRLRWGDIPGWVVADCSDHCLTLWVQTLTPEALSQDLMALTGLPAERITLYGASPARASGLGRHCGDDAAMDAALMSRHLGYPVAVWLDAAYDRDRRALGQAQRITLNANVAKSGEITDYHYHQEHASGNIAAVGLWLCGKAPGRRIMTDDRALFSPYAFRKAHHAERRDAQGADPHSEGLAEIQQAFARESFLDEVARDTGQDPLALRLRHLDDARGTELISSVSRRARWGEPPSPTITPPDRLHGRGFAYAQLPDRHQRIPEGVRSAWIADVEVNRVTGEVALTRLVVGQDAGPEVDTSRLQQTLQARVLGSARPLLGHTPAFDEWGDGSESSGSHGGALMETTTPPETGAGSTSLPMPLHEADLSPGVAVIANALFDATGVRFRQPPFTASRVRRALQDPGNPLQGADNGGPARRSGRRWLKVAALTAVASTAAMAWPWKGAIAPIQRPAANLYSAETIERGRLVAAAGDCAACHTAEGGRENAGGRAFETPFGTLYSTNLTPDEGTGIGRWSYAAFERAMRHGIGRDGRHLYPAFPYTAFAKISDADMQALYAYLMAQPAVSAEAPANALSFPFNMRPLLAGWNALYHDPRPFEPSPTQSDLYNRGAYLAEGLGHCSACHTPRNAMGAERRGEHALAGAMVDGWEAPPLNQLSRSPIPWSEAALYDYLRHGGSSLHGVASGPMAPVVAGLGELPEYDVRALAHYVAVQMGAPAGDSDAISAEASALLAAARSGPSDMEEGERLFEGACAACHLDTGTPSFSSAKTSLALNTNLYSEHPDNVIQSILSGTHAEHVPGVGNMPSFADSFSDSQVATLTAYLRARFAPDQAPWQDIASRVATIRQYNNNTPSPHP